MGWYGGGGRSGAWVGGEVGDGLTYGAADGSGSRRQLQRRPAAGAVDQHEHRRVGRIPRLLGIGLLPVDLDLG